VTTVFLGGGRITGALIAGLRLAKYDQPIVVHDRHPQKLRDLERQYGIKPEENLCRATDQADLLIIAVRPDSVRDLLLKIGKANRRITAVSLAAGMPLLKLRRGLGHPVRWARAMPSPVCRVGRGLTALTFDRGLPVAERRAIKNFFARVGPVLEIPESKFDVFTATYSCSHGYHALAALAAAGQSQGLARKTALTAAAHALADGIVAWREGDISLDALLHEAATPGGIAATTMTAMDKAGHRKAVARGLRAGIERARKHAKR
jgi:pyrroline-5-carboxylate reductase